MIPSGGQLPKLLPQLLPGSPGTRGPRIPGSWPWFPLNMFRCRIPALIPAACGQGNYFRPPACTPPPFNFPGKDSWRTIPARTYFRLVPPSKFRIPRLMAHESGDGPSRGHSRDHTHPRPGAPDVAPHWASPSRLPGEADPNSCLPSTPFGMRKNPRGSFRAGPVCAYGRAHWSCGTLQCM